VKGLRAVAGLQHEGPAAGGEGELILEATSLAREDEGRLGGELALDAREVLTVGPGRRLGE
jgi:hypothetical protein